MNGLSFTQRRSPLSSTPVSATSMSMNTVPADVLLEIADYLSCPSEVLHLYLTVRPPALRCNTQERSNFSFSNHQLVFTNRRCTHTGTLFPHRPARPRPMHPHPRHALRAAQARTTRPFSHRLPGPASAQRADTQVGPHRLAGRLCGFVGGAARGAAL